jgi:tetraprenyl-beta-curcumene synthase
LAGRALLSLHRLHALALASSRELRWGLRAVSDEVQRWRALAATIPDEELREDALRALDYKRASIDGGALFWTLPRRRNPSLLRLLVAYEILADFLDCASERAAHVGIDNGLRLHRALRDALVPDTPLADYYRYHPWREDSCYIHLLTDICRQMCALLPSFHIVRPFVDHAAGLTEVLALNHEPDPDSRDAALHAWAKGKFPTQPELAWFEWCASASAWLTIFALLAIAADVGWRTAEAEKVHDVYLQVSLVGTMLDSYADITEDEAENAHSYIAHYHDHQAAVERVVEVLAQSLREIAGLHDGHRHFVVAGCMVAMFLSKDSTRAATMRNSTSKIIWAGGPLIYALVPVLRVWRIVYGQRSA